MLCSCFLENVQVKKVQLKSSIVYDLKSILNTDEIR